MEIYYLNNIGQSINFMDGTYMISESDLFNYEWSYESESSVNSKISRFYREFIEKSIKISVSAVTPELYEKALSNLLEVTERDIMNLTPGKLYVGEEYLPCYFCKSEKSNWMPEVEFLVNTFSLISEKGFWISEKFYEFKSGEIITTNNKKHPYRYPYRYANGLTDASIINEHFADANFQMIFYGPCLNPHVIIGGHRYQINILLETGELLTIDSKERTVKKTMNDGTVVNAFHNRNKQDSVFRSISPGRNQVSWAGTFDFDIALYAERSEPKCR